MAVVATGEKIDGWEGVVRRAGNNRGLSPIICIICDIKPNLRPVLDRFATTLNQNPVTTVKIIGHTDSAGSDAVNGPLSVNRAGATRDYLVARGVAINRISIDGRGSHEPVADNGTPAGRAMNRRVEIFVAEPTR